MVSKQAVICRRLVIMVRDLWVMGGGGAGIGVGELGLEALRPGCMVSLGGLIGNVDVGGIVNLGKGENRRKNCEYGGLRIDDLMKLYRPESDTRDIDSGKR